MPISLPSYILAATLLFTSAITSRAQVQRMLVTDKGETHDTPVPHPLTWWTHNPLRLDASGDLMLEDEADGGHTITTRDYRVKQKVTTLGTISNHRIVQVLTTINPGPRVILRGLVAADRSPAQWKSLLVEIATGQYEELYALQVDDWKAGSAGIYGFGPNSILGTYDPDGGNGGGCSDGYWWFDHAGAHTVDFTELNRAIDRMVPKEGSYTPNCWSLHPKEAYLESWVRRRDATCHACGGLGTVRASYKIQHGVAIPGSVHFEPQSPQSK